MYIKLSPNSFIRFFERIGYITHQFTRQDRVYDEIGKLFLQQIEREPKKIIDIIDNLCNLFIDVDRTHLETDFSDFIEDLVQNNFVIIADNKDDFTSFSNLFSYETFNLREIIINSYQQEHNREASSSDFLHNYFRENPTIFGVHFEVTSKCNEKCIHCYIPSNVKRENIDLHFAIDLLDQLKEMGTLSITFSGGEPFLHPHFLKILEHARKNDFIINILTNGTIIDAKILNGIKDLNIAKIQVSLYSMNPEIHDTITTIKGSHQITLENILLIVNKGIPLQISCPVIKTNKDSYKDVVKWGKSIGVRVLSDFVLMGQYNCDTSNLNLRLDIKETEEVIKTIIEEEDEYRAIFEKKEPADLSKVYHEIPICGIGVDNVCISYDGILYPCSGFQGIILGDAKRDKLSYIWRNSKQLIALRNLKRKKFDKCNSCEAMEYCVMCLVRNYNENNGDMYKISPHYCDVAFLTKKLVGEEFFNSNNKNG